MSASEIISSHLSASSSAESSTLELFPLRFHGASSDQKWTANRLRGIFGSTLKTVSEEAYARFFTPTAGGTGRTVPSGLRDLPRPFVFRLREEEVGVNLFLTSEVDLVCRVMAELELALVSPPELLHVPLDSPLGALDERQRLRVRFLTPTELKGAGEPDFGTLIARVRDRVSTLRALYGPGPLDLDFRAFGERASRVRMTRCELQVVKEERLSKGTGQRHSIGGFTGVAEYDGPVAEFLPYLGAARWTGVGRQTVWGKGEIAVEMIRE